MSRYNFYDFGDYDDAPEKTMQPYDYQAPPVRQHACLRGHLSTEPSWWEHDAHGIPLCRVCDDCRAQKLARYRPEILTGYTEDDVNEPIEPDYGYGEEHW